MWPPSPLTRPLRALARPPRAFQLRLASQNAKPKRAAPPEPVQEAEDHRRPWFWTANRVSNFAIIPAALLYCVFFADFGEGENVFSAPRRWLKRQKETFFSLSPEEQQLVHENAENTHDQTAK